MGTSLQISALDGDSKVNRPEEPHTSQAGCPQDAPGEDWLAGLPRPQQHQHLSPFLEKKKEDPRSLRAPQSMWEPEGEELQQDQEMGAPRMGTCRENSTPDAQGQGEGAEGVLKGAIATESEGRGILLRAGGQGTTAGTQEGGAEWGHVQRLLVSGPRGVTEDAMSGGEQGWEVPSILGEPRVLRILGTREASTTEKPQEETGVTSVTRGEEQAEVALQGVVKVRAAELCAYSLLSKLTLRW